MPTINVVETQGIDVTVEVKCTECNKPQRVTMTQSQLAELTGGGRRRHIQDILYTHRPVVRELFVSGMCASCWDRIFKPMEEQDL